MADHTTKVRDVAWSEMLPWLMLFRSVRIALLARVLVLGALGLAATWWGWRFIADVVFSRSTDQLITNWTETTSLGLWDHSTSAPPPSLWVNTAARSAGEVFESASEWLLHAPITIWMFLTRPFLEMFHTKTATGFLFLLVCAVWELLVWGLFGGAITRIAALKFTRDEAPGLVAALKHSAAKLPSYSLPPLVALAGAAVFGLQLVALGAIMRVDVLAFLAALAWPFVLLLGLMMAILLLGALAGWPLMWATVSVEGTDAFDALSRSYAYTYHRPWRLLWYVIFAGFLAVTSMFVVKLFASSAIGLGTWSIDWGLDDTTMNMVVRPEAPRDGLIDPALPQIEVTPGAAVEPAADTARAPALPPAESGRVLSAARRVINFWRIVVTYLVAGYQAGFLWVSAVGIYLLLRRDIDGVQINEVFIDPSEFGLPPLTDDAATGVPEVAPGQPAIPADDRLSAGQ